jgi:uridine kinase
VDSDAEATLARIIDTAPRGRRALVAIDGVGASGKTTFAAALARSVETRPVVVLHVDDFFNPAAIRHARGRYSPEGFWLDSYNYDALTSWALDPLRPSGDGWFRAAAIDHDSGRVTRPAPVRAADDALVLVDGTFLHRRELASYWDSSVFLDVPSETAVRRMSQRAGGGTGIDAGLRQRYFGAQLLYFTSSRPWERARLVVDNTDPDHPKIIEAGAAAAAAELASAGG